MFYIIVKQLLIKRNILPGGEKVAQSSIGLEQKKKKKKN
jgi:hypothetical protein